MGYDKTKTSTRTTITIHRVVVDLGDVAGKLKSCLQNVSDEAILADLTDYGRIVLTFREEVIDNA